MDAGLWIVVVALACLVLSVAGSWVIGRAGNWRRRTSGPDFRERKRKGEGNSE